MKFDTLVYEEFYAELFNPRGFQCEFIILRFDRGTLIHMDSHMDLFSCVSIEHNHFSFFSILSLIHL